jgi:hypothetical protein
MECQSVASTGDARPGSGEGLESRSGLNGFTINPMAE